MAEKVEACNPRKCLRLKYLTENLGQQRDRTDFYQEQINSRMRILELTPLTDPCAGCEAKLKMR